MTSLLQKMNKIQLKMIKIINSFNQIMKQSIINSKIKINLQFLNNLNFTNKQDFILIMILNNVL